MQCVFEGEISNIIYWKNVLSAYTYPACRALKLYELYLHISFGPVSKLFLNVSILLLHKRFQYDPELRDSQQILKSCWH